MDGDSGHGSPGQAVIVVWRAIRALWNRRRRKIDIQILWPLCRDGAGDLENARDAFAMHAMNDSAWSDLTGEEIYAIIMRLT